MPEQPEGPKVEEDFSTSLRSDKPTNTIIAKSQEDSNRPENTDIAKSADDTNRPNQTDVAQGQVKSAEKAKKENPAPKPEEAIPSAAARQKAAKQTLAQTSETAPPPSGTVTYISTATEAAPFPLIVGPGGEERIEGVWSSDRKQILWHVPKELAGRVEKHSHIATGRLMKVNA